MWKHTKLPKKQLYIILGACAVIIFAISIETMMRVKDLDLFNLWLQNTDFNGMQYTEDEYFNFYLTANLGIFFQNLIVPMAYGIYIYFAYVKIRINGLFVLMWTLLSLGGLALTIIELNLYSAFYYIRIIGYLVLIFTTLSLINVNESKHL